MAGRDDFGSGMKSPGGWGGSGGGAGGGMGGGKSSSNYNYRDGAGQRGPAIGNWNTGGRVVGTGNQFGVNGFGENNMGRGPWPGGYATPVLRRPVPPALLGVPQPGSYPPPPVTQEDIPGFKPSIGTAPQGVPGTTGYYDMREALGYNPYHNSGWNPGVRGGGGVFGVNPSPRQQGGSLGGATYAGMGSDFRSIDSW